MNIEGRVYDKGGDIFYNDKYLNVLKEKEYYTKIDDVVDKQIYKLDLKFEPIGEQTYKLETDMDRIKFIENVEIKNYMMYHFRKLLNINKYLLSDLKDEWMLSYTYILKKYGKFKFTRKKILVLDMSMVYLWQDENHYIEKDGTLFIPSSLDLFENTTNNDIYALFFYKNKKKYNKIAKNKKNTYHFINYDNDGNMMESFDKNFDRIKNMKFDLIISKFNPGSFVKKNKYFNTYFFLLMYIILSTTHTKSHIIIRMSMKLLSKVIYNIMTIIASHYKHKICVKPKYSSINNSVYFWHFTGLNKKSKITFTKKIFNKNFYLKSIGVANKLTNVDKLFKKFTKDKIKRSLLLKQIAHYIYDEQYNTLKKIMLNYINIKQKAYCKLNKNNKYINYNFS